MPPTLKKYQALQRKKKSYCAGRATKADVKKAASVYVTAAVAKGQTKTEAQKKANKVLNGACKLKSASATTRKRKTTATARKRKTTTAARKRTRARA